MDYRIRDGVKESAVKSVIIESFRGGSDRYVMGADISYAKSVEDVAEGMYGPDGEFGPEVEDGLDGEDGAAAVLKGRWEHEKTQ
ncbi:MAG: hypothetical protein LBR80_03160 [Deltaproteobacteria bacterium]|nr:hypothetical protein [Deltaproteobacteria bacterium]